MTAHRPNVVVVGGGFAGLNAVHALRHADADVTLVDARNYHTFQPLLYQVATAYLPAEEVGTTLRAIFRRQRNVTVRLGTVTTIEAGDVVRLDAGDLLPFDYLIVAAGAESNYFGIAGMEQHAWPLYTLPDAARLRARLLALEYTQTGQPASPATVVVVGGGPTGVETAGALATMTSEQVGPRAGLHVVLVEAAARLLSAGFTARSSQRACADLRGRGVEIRLGVPVASADEHGVTLADGSRIEAAVVVWAAGVHANALGGRLGLETGRQRRILVDNELRVPGHDRVFAAGDISATPTRTDATALPMLAPAAIQTGAHAGAQVARLIRGQPLVPFRYRDKGMVAVLGRGDAVAELPLLPGAHRSSRFRWRFAGRAAWLLWLGVHIVYLIGFRNRLKVLIDWGWTYFTSHGQGALLLTPDAPALSRPSDLDPPYPQPETNRSADDTAGIT